MSSLSLGSFVRGTVNRVSGLNEYPVMWSFFSGPLMCSFFSFYSGGVGAMRKRTVLSFIYLERASNGYIREAIEIRQVAFDQLAVIYFHFRLKKESDMTKIFVAS